ncbi:MAG: hypothetical protein PGN09_10400 [Sphingomonas fennica]
MRSVTIAAPSGAGGDVGRDAGVVAAGGAQQRQQGLRILLRAPFDLGGVGGLPLVLAEDGQRLELTAHIPAHLLQPRQHDTIAPLAIGRLRRRDRAGIGGDRIGGGKVGPADAEIGQRRHRRGGIDRLGRRLLRARRASRQRGGRQHRERRSQQARRGADHARRP